ncbi:MAG TPA: hypothetical protein VG815_01115, partial [Chloroflexota bacterium]|nr:hypothetical protein [Chloroflexota bacterium]
MDTQLTFQYRKVPVHGRRRGRRAMLALGIVAALILAATGVAMANIPDAGTGIFHGCVATNGSLRVIDPSKG